MTEIQLDGSSWCSVNDFYDALFLAIGAPEWHGRNRDALIDSMIWGGINSLEPPYRITIFGAQTIPDGVRRAALNAAEAISKAREDRRTRDGEEIDVRLEVDA